MSQSGWVGVDLDGTLARYTSWKGLHHIGAPVPEMVARVRRWLERGREIRIFTARFSSHGVDGEDVVSPIEEWCIKHIGQPLPVTNVKDFGLRRLFDDRAVQVELNTGRILGVYDDV